MLRPRRVVEVEPVGGTLVLFDARTLLHEVSPHAAAADRIALTLWIGGAHDVWGGLRYFCASLIGDSFR